MSSRGALLGVFACLAIFAAPNAAAQGSPSTPPTEANPAPSPIIPPRLITHPDAPYPEGATGDATVVLGLTVGTDGSVLAVHPIAGEEPFAAAAVEVARRWQFEPATRAGKPVAAIIRIEVSYKAPVETEPEAPPDLPVPNPSAGEPPPPPKPLEVTIRGARLAPTVSSFTRGEVRQLPGAFGDPFRAIEALPGVTPIVSGLPFFYVRGAPPGNVGYFFDGVRVPYLYHVGLGPSVIHPAMVERVDLYPGGYPARYGRFAGGIVTGEATAPRNDLHGEGNIRLFDAGVLAETGFADGRGTVLLGGRYSYTATILSLIVKDTKLDYRDYQARVTYDLTPKDRLTAFGFGSYDLLAQTTGGLSNILFGSEFYRLDLRYDHSFGPESTLRYAVTLGYDQTRFLDQRNAQDRMVGTRIELNHALSKGLLLRAGADFTRDGYAVDKSSYVDPEDPTIRHYDSLFPARVDFAGGAWADVVLDVTPRIQVTPGVRLDAYESAGSTAFAVDPRISARFAVSDKFRIIHAYGITHQAPGFIVPVPGLIPGGLQGGLQTALQASAGVETDLPEAFTATATVFDNVFLNMSDVLGITTGDVTDNLDRRALGSAVGLEIFVRRSLTKRLGGFLTYTLSRSNRSVGNQTFPSAFDRTHVANAALAYNLGRNWRAGTRLVFYTGGPKIVEYHGATPPPPSTSAGREPAFYRVDVRLEKRWTYDKNRWLSFVAEVLNTTFHKETVQSQPIGPVTIPSIGLEGGF
jgi:hypothetical protein